MQGLGMNDGDKGGGTAGAQAKLETSKMILLTVPNLLDQPSYSVDQLHRLALLAARKAKETRTGLDNHDPGKESDSKESTRTSITFRWRRERKTVSVRSVGEDSSLNDKTISNIEAYVTDVGTGAYTRLSVVTEFHGLLDTIGELTFAIPASSSLLANPTVFNDADEHDSLLWEIVLLITSGHERNVEVTFLTMIVVLVVLERMRRKGKMDEDEEEGITNAQSNELDMNDNLAVRFMNPQIPHSMTPRKSLTMTPIAGPHPSSSKITDIIHASAAAIHAPPRIGSGEADNVAVPDEPAERLGITRHGHTDELGAADQGERHAIGDKATKDGAGAGGRASGGVDLGCGDVARAYPDHGERRTQHPLDLLPPDDAVSGSGARVCVGSTDADVCSDADRQVGVSGHSVSSFLGCGAKYSGSAGCVPDAAAGGQQLVHT
ncbi:hypothetical protein BLNAU_1054 [Blattamonas nauphoetae]|uniref:Uncharacterized protein n=1 Tax=Blattamonas nauphoetae TaxID=2049346 RepID=A0ABQ9YJQ7_9EUKA|nr:hypothetical protein BLNAU_1054 [Blattamonas nauphoetae]